ncbi:unnamed protein product [Urochloa humidicola]
MSRQLQSRKEAAAATRDLLKVDAARVCKLGRWCPEAEARGGSDAEWSGGTGEEGCGGADVAGPRRARVPLCAGTEEFGICFCYSTKILLHGIKGPIPTKQSGLMKLQSLLSSYECNHMHHGQSDHSVCFSSLLSYL